MSDTANGESKEPAKKAADANPAKTASKKKKKGTGDTLWYRRNFLSIAGYWSLLAFIGANILAFTRFMFPRVLFEPISIFKAGRPEEFGIGDVSTKFVQSYRVWIIREERGFFALHAKCTHLGCTPRWLEAEQKFKCPCHGTGFTKEGINFEGPAPTPLRRLRIQLSDDGQLVVDVGKKYRQENGEWSDEESYLVI